MKKKLIALALLILFGVARIPVEDHLSREMVDGAIHEKPIDAELRERLPQIGFMAALGGLRSLVASILDLKAHIAFEEYDWAANEKFYDLITTLQPSRESYWETGSWHRLRNAVGHYRHRSPQMRPAAREQRAEYYIENGFELLERGVRMNPESSKLHASLASYVTTLNEHSIRKDGKKAAFHYEKAFEYGGKPFHERMLAYELARLPDREGQLRAYQIMVRYFNHFSKGSNNPNDVPLSISKTLKYLEDELGIPEMQRIYRGQAPPEPVPANSPEDIFQRLQKPGGGR